MDDSILSGDLKLSAHVAVPNPPLPSLGLVLCHGLPNPPRGAVTVGTTYPDLADHIAHEAGWTVLTFNFRGTGTSEGDFSAHGWLDDLRNAVRVLHARPEVRGVWVAGFGHGGTFAVSEAADDHLVRGVATIASPSTLRDWAQDPGRLLNHARSMGMIRSENFPSDATRWVRDIGRVDADRGGSPARSSTPPRAARRRGRGGARCRRPCPRRRRPSQLRAQVGAGRRSSLAPRPARDRDAARVAGAAGAERDRHGGAREQSVKSAVASSAASKCEDARHGAGTERARMRSRETLSTHLEGAGIEVGPGNVPFAVPPGVVVRYVDRLTSTEHSELFYELPMVDFVEPDIVADLDTDGLTALDSQSQDFVICSHVLEHLADPLGFLEEAHRVLRIGGVLLILLPDRRYTFDRGRDPTPLACLLRDHAEGATTPDDDHMVEFLLGADQGPDFSLPTDEDARAQLFAWHRDRSIHVHCWTDPEFREVLDYCIDDLGQHWEMVERLAAEETGMEFGYVLTRALEKPKRRRRFLRRARVRSSS